MAIKVFDDFNGNAGVDIANHTPDVDVVGTGWVQDSGNEVELDGSGALKFNNSGEDCWIDVGSVDQVLTTNFSAGGADNRVTISVRRDSAASGNEDAYGVNFRPASSPQLVINRKINGTNTELNSITSLNTNANDTYEITISIIGTVISVSLDGVPVISAIDSNITNGTFSGLKHELRNSSNARFFDFTVDDSPPLTGLSVSFSLSGAIAETTAKIVGRVSGATSTLKLEHADNPSFTSSTLSPLLTVDADFLTKVSLTGLVADTQYYYRYVDDGNVIADVFKFETVSNNQAYSFKIGVGGCSKSVTSPTWDRLNVRDIKGFISLGDTPYIDDETIDGIPQKNAYFTWLARSDVRSLLDIVPYTYTWDDHDFGNDNSTGANPAKVAQQANYRNIFPSYDLELPSLGAIYYSYTIGRVRFIVFDVRSERGNIASEVMIAPAQMTWIKQELTDFEAQKALGNLRAVVMCSGVQWTDNTRSESWSRAPAQRTEITDHIVSLGIEGDMLVVSANLHAMGADTGANNDYGTGGTGGFPHFCASAMATPTGTTETDTGEYDLGIFGSSNGGSEHQYGILEFIDDGNDFSINFKGYTADTDTALIDYTFFVTSIGVTITPQTVNSLSVSLNPSFTFSSAFTLSPNTVNSSSVSLGPSFTFNSVFTLSPETVNSSSDSLDPNFTYSNAFTLNPQVVNSLSVSIDPSFTYTGPFNLSPNVVNSNSIALRPLFNYGQAQTIGTVTASFAPDLYTAQFKD